MAAPLIHSVISIYPNLDYSNMHIVQLFNNGRILGKEWSVAASKEVNSV